MLEVGYGVLVVSMIGERRERVDGGILGVGLEGVGNGLGMGSMYILVGFICLDGVYVLPVRWVALRGMEWV